MRSPWVRWPVTLIEVPVVLRPLRRSDRRAWEEVRHRNAAWLGPWEASSPTGAPPADFGEYVRALSRSAREGSALPFAIGYDGELVGQLTVSSIIRGSLWSGSIGYWISRDVAGRGIMPLAVAMASDFAFFELGLHRLEINIRPENVPSLRVVEKLGFRDEGVRERFLHIDGDWRDHRTFALTSDEVPGGLVKRLREAGGGVR